MNLESFTKTLPNLLSAEYAKRKDQLSAEVFTIKVIGLARRSRNRPNCSFLIPSRFRPKVLEDCMDNLLKVKMAKDEVLVAIHKPDQEYCELMKKYADKVVFLKINYDCPLAHIWNRLVLSAKYPNLFVLNDKARPDRKAINKALLLHEKGFGLCGLYRYGFFFFNKFLIYKIGWFEERFVDGGYEDNDFTRRICEANIAYYENEEIDYIQLPTLYRQNKSKGFFGKKWTGPFNSKRYLAEQNLYPEARKAFKKYKQVYLHREYSYLMRYHLDWFNYTREQYAKD